MGVTQVTTLNKNVIFSKWKGKAIFLKRGWFAFTWICTIYNVCGRYDQHDDGQLEGVIGLGVKRTWTPSRGRSTSSPIKIRSSRFSSDSR